MISNQAGNIDEFIAQYPPATQKLLKQMRATIHKAHNGFEEAIAYGIPTFRLSKRNVVHFSGYEKHIGFYPGATGIVRFTAELKGYVTSKGTVQFPVDKPLPVDLITRMVKWCAAAAEEHLLLKKKAAPAKKAAATKKAVKTPAKKASKTAKKKA
jgi:uncharacterized protein YdhG (YjbR/CyaY superfamily)